MAWYARVVSFPDDFSLSGGKIRLVIRLFHFGSGARNVGALFYFNLTRDVTHDYIPKFLNA